MPRLLRFSSIDDVSEMNDAELITHLMEKMGAIQPYVTSYATYQRRGDHCEDPEHPTSQPYVVSIGPYNHAGTNYSIYMDNIKWRCLHFLFSKRNNCDEFQSLLDMLSEIDAKARSFYGEATLTTEVEMRMRGKNFTKILILDGFFIICYALSRSEQSSWSENNPLCTRELDWLKDWIKHDLLLTDNQIPFEVVKIILKWLNLEIDCKQLIEVMYNCLMVGYAPISDAKKSTAETKNFHHILHLYHHFIELDDGWNDSEEDVSSRIDILDNSQSPLLIPPNQSHGRNVTVERCESRSIQNGNVNNCDSIQPIGSATELEEAYVKFKLRTQNECSSPLDVKFDKQTGVLEIPLIRMTVSWKTVLENIMDFEEFTEDVETHVTAYVYFMFCLLKNKEDVRILRKKGIIQNKIGTEDDTAKFFIDLWRKSNGFINYFPRKYLFDDIKEHEKHLPNHWKTSLKAYRMKIKRNPLLSFTLLIFIFQLIQVINTIFSLIKTIKSFS